MSFEKAVEHVLKVEGGYVDHPSDPGGETNYGISKRSYPHLDIRNLTREDAIAIYKRDFWDALDCDRMEERLAFMAFDAAVNHGVWRVREWLKHCDTLESLTGMRLRFYAALSTWDSFGKGWTRRMAAVLEAIDRLPNPLLPVTELFVTNSAGKQYRTALHTERPARVVGSKLYVNLREPG